MNKDILLNIHVSRRFIWREACLRFLINVLVFISFHETKRHHNGNMGHNLSSEIKKEIRFEIIIRGIGKV